MPRHMRLNFVQRLLRFLFWPICAMAAVAMLRHEPLYEQIADYCERRVECQAACVNSNFPFLNCEKKEVEIEYNGNTYTNFFFYPHPTEDKSQEELHHYHQCQNYINDVSKQSNSLIISISFLCRTWEYRTQNRVLRDSSKSTHASQIVAQMQTAISALMQTIETNAQRKRF